MILLLHRPSLLDILTSQLSKIVASTKIDEKDVQELEYVYKLFALILGTKKDGIRTIISLWESNTKLSLESLFESNAYQLCMHQDSVIFKMGLRYFDLLKSFPLDSVDRLLTSLLDFKDFKKEEIHLQQLEFLLEFIQDGINEYAHQVNKFSKIMNRLLLYKLNTRSKCVKRTINDVYFEIPFKFRRILESTNKLVLSFYLTNDNYKFVLQLVQKSVNSLIINQQRDSSKEDYMNAFVIIMDSFLFFEKYVGLSTTFHSDEYPMKSLISISLNLFYFVNTIDMKDAERTECLQPIKDKLKQFSLDWMIKIPLYPAHWKYFIDYLFKHLPQQLDDIHIPDAYINHIISLIHGITLSLKQGSVKKRERAQSSCGNLNRNLQDSIINCKDSKTDQDLSRVELFKVELQKFIKNGMVLFCILSFCKRFTTNHERLTKIINKNSY